MTGDSDEQVLSQNANSEGQIEKKLTKELKFSPDTDTRSEGGHYIFDPKHGLTEGLVNFVTLNGKINVSYTETLFAYLYTAYGKIDLGKTTILRRDAVLSDGIKAPETSYYNKEEFDDVVRVGDNYIRDHANHFLEEAYEKIPEARNADEIIY